MRSLPTSKRCTKWNQVLLQLRRMLRGIVLRQLHSSLLASSSFMASEASRVRVRASEWHLRLLSRAALACLLATPPNGELVRRLGSFQGVLLGLIVEKAAPEHWAE